MGEQIADNQKDRTGLLMIKIVVEFNVKAFHIFGWRNNLERIVPSEIKTNKISGKGTCCK